jgi:hypothetical protein
MRLADRTEQLWNIDPEQRIVVHSGSDGRKIIVVPGEKTDKYGEFDIQIRIEGGRGYQSTNPPSHPAVFKDLHAKRSADEAVADELFDIIDEIYYGADPEKYADRLAEMGFVDDTFPADVTVILLQTMMVEQEINYGPGGEWTRYDPPRDLLMSCVRWIRSGEYEEIDEISSSGYMGRTPSQYHFDGEEIWTRPEY